MSSFRKKFPRSNIKGTKTCPQTGQIITGSGNPALDELLGGGIPMNSIVLIEEDKHCIYSKVLCKFFIAEGIVQRQRVFLASLDDSPEEIFKKLPDPVFFDVFSNDVPQEYEKLSQDTSNLRIAWRYNDLPYLNVEKTHKRDDDHHFNLLNYMPENKVASASKFLWDGVHLYQPNLDDYVPKIAKFDLEKYENDDESTSSSTDESSFFSNKLFENLIDALQGEMISILDDFGRICIPSLGSPLWYDDNFGEDLLKFLTILRAFVQNQKCACFISMPMHLIAKYDELLVPKIRNLVDYAIELESFAGSERETNPAFKEYNGLLHFKKMSAINSLALFQHSDLAFKLRRKRFIIEKFHLPPELDQSEQYSEDVISKTTPISCASSSASSTLSF